MFRTIQIALTAGLLCLAIVAAVLRPGPVAAASDPPPPVARSETCLITTTPDADLMRRLLGWIGQATDYDITGLLSDLPDIKFCKTGQVIRYEGSEMIVDRSLNAAYDAMTQQIWLVEPWTADDLRQRSVLLHELVHHVQFQSRDWPCPQASEEEAYRLQHSWLAEHGVASGFNWFVIRMRSRCPREVHP